MSECCQTENEKLIYSCSRNAIRFSMGGWVANNSFKNEAPFFIGFSINS